VQVGKSSQTVFGDVRGTDSWQGLAAGMTFSKGSHGDSAFAKPSASIIRTGVSCQESGYSMSLLDLGDRGGDTGTVLGSRAEEGVDNVLT
jgi:hypothetical protein